MVRAVTSTLCAICWCNLSLAATIITFDELPFQPADGISLHGVTFNFTIGGVDSLEASFASFGPGDLSTVSDPSLTGRSDGVLTLNFATPTPQFEFGVALSTAESLSPGFLVELFDVSLQSLGATSVDTVAFGGNIAFSEARFAHSGMAVAKAVIDFADTPGSFALDNLVFVVPEPSAFLLSLTGVCWLLARRRTHRTADVTFFRTWRSEQ